MTATTTTTESHPDSGSKPRGRRKKNKSEGGNPAVDSVAADLGLDPEASAAQAALDEAAGVNVTETPEVEGEETPPTETTAGVEELTPRMQETLQPAAVPPPKPTKEEKAAERVLARDKRQQQTPSTKKLGPLGAKLPGAEHVRIHKRMENGQRGYVGMYGTADLARSHDIEAFIHRYIKPSFGPGEYQITGVTALGQEIDGGSVIVLGPSDDAPPPQPQNNAAMDLLQQLLARDEKRRAEEMEALRSQPNTDPIDQITKLHDLSKSMTGEVEGEQKSTLAALISTMGQQSQANMQLILQLMQKSDERMATLMQTIAKPKEMDPVLGLILTKLLEDKGSSSGPLPPPPPPPDPTENLKNMAEVLAVLRPPEDTTTPKLLEVILARSEQERMTPADVLNLVNQVKGERGTDDFKKSMENLGFMMNAVQTIRQNTEGGGGGFWDALGALVSNRELGSALASTIRSKQGGAPDPQRTLVDHSGRPLALGPGDMNSRAAALEERRRELEERRLNLAERQLQRAEEALETERGQRQPHQPRRPVQAAQPQPQRRRRRRPPEEETTATAAAQEAAAVERVRRARPDGAYPQLPEDIADYVNPLMMAMDDGARIEALINLFIYLDDHEDWQDVARTMLHFLHEGDLEQSLSYVGSFLEGMQQINLLDPEAVRATLHALQAHFGEVVEHVREALADEMHHDPEEDAGFTELMEGGNALGLEDDEGGDDEGDDDYEE